MRPINAIIVEDMTIAEEHLKKLLRDNCPQINVIASYTSAKEAIKHLPELNYDLLFLDIEYNDGYNAFKMLEELDFTETHIIFTTAYDSYRRESSDVNSIKYLLKPIKKEELILAVERSMLILIGKSRLPLIQQTHEAIKTGKIIINTDGISYFLDPSNIIYMEASGAYTSIFYYTEQKLKQLTSTQNLGKYENKLPKQNFIRVHKKYLVNTDFIDSCRRNKLKIVAGKISIEILISKDRRKEIMDTISSNRMEF